MNEEKALTLQLADAIWPWPGISILPYGQARKLSQAAAELRRLHHNNRVLMDALWKACGDDEDTVKATIESQGDLK